MDTIKNIFKHLLTMKPDEAKEELEIFIRLDKDHPIQTLIHPQVTNINELEKITDPIIQAYTVEKLGRGMTKEEMDYLMEHKAIFLMIFVVNLCLASIMLEKMRKKTPVPNEEKKEG